MDCPRCHKKTNSSVTDNKYFVGRNSDGIPFFKCEQCGGLFYFNEMDGTSHSISRGEKGYRFVPITWGVFCWLIDVGIFWFFGSNIITWLIGGVFLWIGWSAIKIGIWGSQKLIDEMTLDDAATSKEVYEEWKKINKLE